MPQNVARYPANFLAQLAQNPHGWGNAPPVEQSAMDKEPWNFRGEISNIERPEDYLTPVAETVPPILPGLGGALAGGARNLLALAANPRVAAPIAAGAGFLGGMAGGGRSEDSPVQRLNDARAKLVQQQQDAYNRRETERQSGQGRNFKQADADYKDATAQISSIDKQLNDYANSPEHQQDIQKRADELAAAQKAKEAATPFRERYPAIAGVLPWAGVGASIALPFALRGKPSLGTFLPRSWASKVNRAVSEAETAIASGDAQKAKLPALELKHLLAALPKNATTKKASAEVADILKKAGKETGKAALAAGSGGALAAEGMLLPDQVDAGNLPPGEARDRARATALNPWNYVERGLQGMATGIGGYEAGALFPAKSANVERARAAIEYLRNAGRAKSSSGAIKGVKAVTRKPRGKAND